MLLQEFDAVVAAAEQLEEAQGEADMLRELLEEKAADTSSLKSDILKTVDSAEPDGSNVNNIMRAIRATIRRY